MFGAEQLNIHLIGVHTECDNLREALFLKSLLPFLVKDKPDSYTL